MKYIIAIWAVLTGAKWFRVEYEGGRKSTRMNIMVARDYQKIFGGRVIYDRKGDR